MSNEISITTSVKQMLSDVSTRDQWLDVCRQLKSSIMQINFAGQKIQWEIGDCLNFGQEKYGEKYAEAFDVLGVSQKTARNYASVSGKFQLSRRRDNLSFSIHAEVAYIEDEDLRETLLDRAESEDMSVKDLRAEVKAIFSPPKIEAEPQETAPQPKLNLDSDSIIDRRIATAPATLAPEPPRAPTAATAPVAVIVPKVAPAKLPAEPTDKNELLGRAYRTINAIAPSSLTGLTIHILKKVGPRVAASAIARCGPEYCEDLFDGSDCIVDKIADKGEDEARATVVRLLGRSHWHWSDGFNRHAYEYSTEEIRANRDCASIRQAEDIMCDTRVAAKVELAARLVRSDEASILGLIQTLGYSFHGDEESVLTATAVTTPPRIESEFEIIDNTTDVSAAVETDMSSAPAPSTRDVVSASAQEVWCKPCRKRMARTNAAFEGYRNYECDHCGDIRAVSESPEPQCETEVDNDTDAIARAFERDCESKGETPAPDVVVTCIHKVCELPMVPDSECIDGLRLWTCPTCDTTKRLRDKTLAYVP